MSNSYRRLLRAAAFVAATAIVFAGAFRWSSGSAQGGPIDPRSSVVATPTTQPVRLRLATFNIHSGVGMDDKFDLSRTAAVLQGFDFITVNEARGATPGSRCNVDDLEDKLDMGGVFEPTELWWGRPWFGSGMLTKTRIDHWERTPLPSPLGGAYRQIVHLTMPFGSETLNILNVHLGKKLNRNRQWPVVADMFRKLPTPAILMGDMNTRPYEPEIRQLVEGGDIEDPVAQRMIRPRDRVDYILVRGVHWNDAGLVENKASDHPMVWVEIESK